MVAGFTQCVIHCLASADMRLVIVVIMARNMNYGEDDIPAEKKEAALYMAALFVAFLAGCILYKLIGERQMVHEYRRQAEALIRIAVSLENR